jgi:hypothetical protein
MKNLLKNLSIFFLIFIFMTGCVDSPTKDGNDATPKKNDRVVINDIGISSTFFVTEGDNSDRVVNLTIEPNINYSVLDNSNQVTGIRLDNISVEKHKEATKFIFPQSRPFGSTNYYYGDVNFQPKPSEVKDEGSKFNYKLLDDGTVIGNYDQINRSNGILMFKMVNNNIAKQTGGNTYGIELIKENNINTANLENTLTFDLIFEFADGKVSKSKIKIVINDKLLQTVGFAYVEGYNNYYF